jgi:probable rRNA maturation factor
VTASQQQDANVDRRRRIYCGPWRIDVMSRPGVGSALPISAIARAVGAVLESAAAPEPGSVTVVLTDDEELADLNIEHMGHEGPTDVLSFPMLEPTSFRRSVEAPGSSARKPAIADRQARTHIGDIAISVERAAEQAEQGRGGQTGDVQWSAADELRLLVTHGTLHLCGWDHAEPDQEAAMRVLERQLLERGEG